jgi:Ca-activated chloride channel family protein
MRRIANSLTALVLAGGTVGALPNPAAAENVMIVFDGSNSMWGQIDGTAKIEIARNVMDNLLGEWVDTRDVGLMAYGHRRRGDCTDIEILVQPGQDTRAGILDRIGTITPTGRTPLTSAIEQAATTLSHTDEPATVVLISDGVESCDRDPCAVSQALEQAGIGFTAHVVGFGLGDADAGALSCIAENTGGQYLSARNADELGQALSAVGTAVAAAPEPTPEPEPEPEPTYDVALTAPATALAGSAFEVSWTGAISGNDYITVVPMGADEGTRENHFRVRDYDAKDLRAPSETGLYEVRYVLDEGRRTLASQQIEVTEPEVSLSAPDTALAGSAFEVSWTGAISGNDYITIVPMGADEGTRENHFRVRDYDAKDLRAPSETGLYEVRYVLDEGRRTLASQQIEVTEPEVTLTAPAEIRAGSSISVTWTGTVSGSDYVTIVPMGTDEGARETHFRVRDNSEDSFAAPDQTGFYEIRYVLDEGRRTLASQPIEVLAADAALEQGASLDAPDSAAAGSTITVGWEVEAESADQRITIARADQAIFTWETAVRLEGQSPLEITLPDDPGGYELRLLDLVEQEVLARKPIQVE